ncbi:MAG: thiol oxidoreductase [Actinobacteria bacterium]|nr:thiol oxidoreductase [Actinomycetota bacterium]
MSRRLAAALAALTLVVASCGHEAPEALDARLGGDTSRAGTGQNAFGLPAPSLTSAERQLFEMGDSLFTKNWVSAPSSTTGRDGLGPLFNAHACSGCHLRDGRGVPIDQRSGDQAQPRIGLLMRLSVPGAASNEAPFPDPVYGGQLQDFSLDGTPAEGRIEVTYTDVPGTFADGTAYTLRSPTYRIVDLAYGPLADDVMLSPRLAPQVIGMGLLEAVPAATIEAAADPDDADGDGISGRVNVVRDLTTGEPALGRFGWKAGQPSVEMQSRAAFSGDLGLTSSVVGSDDCTTEQTACRDAVTGGEPEVTDQQMAAITFYGRVLSVPEMRDPGSDDVVAGSQAFSELGCASCHTPTLVTGESAITNLADQTIHPYTDLLLHDMGDGLADGRPEFDATGTEWRTPPLWGLGLIDDVSGGERFLLHDGRARTIDEAILWHGGEAAAAAAAYRQASADTRRALNAFLESL